MYSFDRMEEISGDMANVILISRWSLCTGGLRIRLNYSGIELFQQYSLWSL